MPDVADGLGEQRPARGDLRRPFEIRVAGQGPDPEDTVLHAQVGERLDAVEIHEAVGARQPEVEERHEALAPGEHLHVLVLACEELERLVQLPRSVVRERGGLHEPASRSRDQSLASVNGRST
jgi:hypothetical protein